MSKQHFSTTTLRLSFAFSLIWLVIISMASSADKNAVKDTLKVGEQVPKFILKDAYDNEYSLEKIISDAKKKDLQVIVLVIGDHTTRKNGNKWAKELDKIYKDKKEVEIYMIADLRDLPFYVTESMVKWGTKRENLPVTILLDWKGKISEQYKTKKGESNIFVIDRDRNLRYDFFGKCSPENVKVLCNKIQERIKVQKVERTVGKNETYALHWQMNCQWHTNFFDDPISN